MLALAGELETALRTTADVLLTLAEASTESGYSAVPLHHIVAQGAIPNAGKRGAPRVMRKDLPAKLLAKASGEYDAQADAAAVRRASLHGYCRGGRRLDGADKRT